jgi:hypothetical protein
VLVSGSDRFDAAGSVERPPERPIRHCAALRGSATFENTTPHVRSRRHGRREYFLSRAELLILNDEMLRVATVLILLFSLPSALLASVVVCRDCCNRSVEHQLPLCRDKTHAHLGLHVHHMNHVRTFTQDSEASIVIQECGHQLHDIRLSCHGAACLSVRSVQASISSAPAREQQIPSQLLASAIDSPHAMAAARRPQDICRTAIGPSPAASAPLRI